VKTALIAAGIALSCGACAQPEPRAATNAPAPLAPVPSARQLAWQELEFCAFTHFNMDTFTDREWGQGDEDPDLFDPTELDCRQWARVAKEAGMKGIVLTAKHHDGFSLWPSKLTTHSVASSKWKGGKGDVVRELSDACQEYGLKLGLYLSPWDRNNPAYGTSGDYNAYFAGQLREVLSNYGEVFEVWFDGACGEGPNGKKQVYDWQRFIGVVRELQPNAVMFSDVGPDIRWVGNEDGIAGDGLFGAIVPASVAGTVHARVEWQGISGKYGLFERTAQLTFPVLERACVTLECTPHARHASGDHTVLVGRVERTRVGDAVPAIYFRRDFHLLPVA